jgi:hypothetical protein
VDLFSLQHEATFPRLFNTKILLLFFHDLAHSGRVFRYQTESRVNILGGEKIDWVPFPLYFELIEIEDRNKFQRLYFRPVETHVLVSLYDHDFILPHSHTFDLAADEQENEKENKSDDDKEEGDEKISTIEAKPKKYRCGYQPLDQRKGEKEEFRQIKFNRTRFYHCAVSYILVSKLIYDLFLKML